MSQCPNCKTAMGADAQVCPQCGARPVPGSGAQAAGPQPAVQARPKVTLRVVRADGGPETVVAFNRDQVFAGSGGEIPLLDDPFVAPRQARFFMQGGAVMVEDVGGGNGVFVLVKNERELSQGGEIRCGRQRLVLEPLAPAPTTSPRIWGSPDPGYRARLVQIIEGGRRGDAFPVKDGDNVIGRELGDITFPTDGFVSGRHANLALREGRAHVRDLASSNGTFYRITGPTALAHGDRLLVGRELIKVEMA